MTFERDDILPILLDNPDHFLGQIVPKEDYDLDADDPFKYAVDLRFMLSEEGEKKLKQELAGKAVNLDGTYRVYDVNEPVDIGGMYITFYVYNDGRVIMEDDGFIPFINGNGDYFSMPPYGLDVIEDLFVEAAGGKDPFRDLMLSLCEIEYGIDKDHMCLDIPQDYDVFRNGISLLEDKIREAVGTINIDRIKELFPEPDYDNLTSRGFMDGIEQKIYINGDLRTLYLGVACEGSDYKEQMIDSPWTLQALLDHEVIFCEAVEMEKEAELEK